jgi:hypothetical protein
MSSDYEDVCKAKSAKMMLKGEVKCRLHGMKLKAGSEENLTNAVLQEFFSYVLT